MSHRKQFVGYYLSVILETNRKKIHLSILNNILAVKISLVCDAFDHRYIVECKSEIRPPAYLTMEKTLDLGCIAAQGFQKNLKPFRSLEPSAWPDMEQLGLDESQMKALKLALTKELAIIQGPPGTGQPPCFILFSRLHQFCHHPLNFTYR